MNDLSTLTDAFDELERRADTAPVRDAAYTPTHRTRPALIAASAVAVVAVATTVGLAAAQSNSGSSDRRAATRPALISSPVAASTAAPGGIVPGNATQLERQFTRVLNGSATYTVTRTGVAVELTVPRYPSPTRSLASAPTGSAVPSTRTLTVKPPSITGSSRTSGAAILGELTSAGVTGGYDLQIFQNTAGAKARCSGDASPDRCTRRRLADGSTLATRSTPLPQGAGVTYEAELVRADGTTILLHVSNNSVPEGSSSRRVTATKPPLTITQMTGLVTSDRW